MPVGETLATTMLFGGRWQSMAGGRSSATDCHRSPTSRLFGGRRQSMARGRSSAADCPRQPATDNYSTIARPRVRFPRFLAVHGRDPENAEGKDARLVAGGNRWSAAEARQPTATGNRPPTLAQKAHTGAILWYNCHRQFISFAFCASLTVQVKPEKFRGPHTRQGARRHGRVTFCVPQGLSQGLA